VSRLRFALALCPMLRTRLSKFAFIRDSIYSSGTLNPDPSRWSGSTGMVIVNRSSLSERQMVRKSGLCDLLFAIRYARAACGFFGWKRCERG
jgi:hypothetical protein